MAEDSTPFTPTFTITAPEPGLMLCVFHKIDRDPAVNKMQAEQFRDQAVAIFNKSPQQKFLILVDTRPVGHITFVGTEAQEVYIQLKAHPQIAKMAFVGAGKWLKFMLSTFTQLTGQWRNTKWFDTEDAARAWLKSS